MSAGLRSGLPEITSVTTLRPAPELRELALEVARVLELRLGRPVEVGDPPPGGILEAVPVGHVALGRVDGALQVVLGAPEGRSFSAQVALAADAADPAPRALALALESLQDEAAASQQRPAATAGVGREVSADSTDQEVDAAVAADAEAEALGRPSDFGTFRRLYRDELDEEADEGDVEGFDGEVEPLAYLRFYSGLSSASDELRVGLGLGAGLCVIGQCLIVSGDFPMTPGSTDRLDVRYRYTTFTAGYYSRPFRFGALTPGASLAFLTRLGDFQADMGMGRGGLDTDLGARGTLELAYQAATGLELMVEAGVDFTIDRYQMTTGEALEARGDRWSPWMQAVVRLRP
ncbi:MAG: hypothetical protein OEZ06_01640 [Myxococcales bacterium]|nr:hypothetical protein [Myxococcales bacterium]